MLYNRVMLSFKFFWKFLKFLVSSFGGKVKVFWICKLFKTFVNNAVVQLRDVFKLL